MTDTELLKAMTDNELLQHLSGNKPSIRPDIFPFVENLDDYDKEHFLNWLVFNLHRKGYLSGDVRHLVRVPE